DYAHNKRDAQGMQLRLVHRDISPQNVLISYEGEVKIIDFGIAKAAGRASKTQAGILKGKFGYMSPEQVRGLPLDRRSDIFSLGIILYELLTNERLFFAESDFSILEKIRNVEITSPARINPEIPPELERIVMKALARDPEDRFQSAAEFHDDLQRFMFASGLFYTRKDLSGYLHDMFAEEIEREQAKLEEYRRLSPPPGAVSSRPDLRTLTPALQLHPQTTSPARPSATGRNASARNQEQGQDLELAKGVSTSSHVISWLGQLPAGGSGTPGPLPPPLPGNGSPQGSLMALRQEQLARNGVHDAPAGRSASSPGSNGGSGAGGLDWDEDEAETTVYDRPSRTSSPVEVGELSEADIVYAEPKNERAASRGSQVEPLPLPELRPPALPAGGVGMAAARPRWRMGFLAIFTLAALLGAMVVAYVALSLRGRDTGIHLATDPSDGLEVLLDGQPIHQGQTPIRIQRLSPGTHQLVLRKEGYKEEVRQVELVQDQEATLTVTLSPVGPAPGTIRLVSNPPGATVELDGKPQQGKTPLLLEGLAPGLYKVSLTMPGRELWAQEVEIAAGALVQRTVTLKPATVDLVLDSRPAGAIYTIQVLPDGELRSGETPAKINALPAGAEVALTIEQRGYSRWSKTQRLEAGGTGVITLLAELTRTLELSWLPGEKPSGVKASPRPAPAVRPPVAPTRPRRPVAPAPAPPAPAPPAVSPPVAATLPPPPPVPPQVAQEEGTLKLMVAPYARVFVDGKDIGESPILGHRLPPGPHRVTLINNEVPCRQDLHVDIRPGQVSFVKKVDPPWCSRAGQ
ncbi:MAG: PEGA domain-containing protein, partial [Deltaproteobacteria bacterium]|nr:PEGA domain-containing protein [Deltaproteobacteria bacterium]